MKIDIIHSSTDIAGTNIRAVMDQLIKNPPKDGWPLLNNNEVLFHTWNDRIINAPNSIVSSDAELVIFLARHASVNPVPILTVHPGGNFKTAELGGNDHELGRAAPNFMREVLRNHQRFVPEGYRVSYEITHHGPTDIHVPFFFVEVGSTETEWKDTVATKAAAKSVLMASLSENEETIPLIGFGGTHYAARQTAIALETKGAFGHMMHTRDVGDASKEMVLQMIEKSSAIAAHVDYKALSKGEYSRIKKILSDLDVLEITEGELHKIEQMSFTSWKKFTKKASEIDPDLKIFPHGSISDGEPALIELPSDLFSAAFTGNEEELFVHLDKMGDIFHTTGKGGRVMPILLTTSENRMLRAGDLIALSIQQVTRTYGTLVEDDQITITKKQFDPEMARMFGVPSGPLFGKLAAGEPVTLPDETTVTPDMVTKTIQTTIKLPGLENYS